MGKVSIKVSMQLGCVPRGRVTGQDCMDTGQHCMDTGQDTMGKVSMKVSMQWCVPGSSRGASAGCQMCVNYVSDGCQMGAVMVWYTYRIPLACRTGRCEGNAPGQHSSPGPRHEVGLPYMVMLYDRIAIYGCEGSPPGQHSSPGPRVGLCLATRCYN